ncbi:hypothetical protein E1281_18420 [Actinomadura sp. KC345]|uniref:hypothetical protein n=1 Tax=Actinomadura sp. KC345 TaxID=2530371 RepID=UPI001047EEBF|nr:hypothetical protein [Actinomadura sp. KC345]TDC52862.1 hypothetical protein E1281_18420 [Actinomadura sp. KC345]
MSAAKRKGTAAETAVVNYLRTQGWPHAERRALNGVLDRGDVAGVVGTVVEVKDQARTELAAWLDETARETENDGAAYGVVWHKRRGKGSPADWYVSMSGATFARLLADALGIGNTEVSGG